MPSTEIARRLSPITESRGPPHTPRTRYPSHLSPNASSKLCPNNAVTDPRSPSPATPPKVSSRPEPSTATPNTRRTNGRIPKIIPARPAPPPPRPSSPSPPRMSSSLSRGRRMASSPITTRLASSLEQVPHVTGGPQRPTASLSNASCQTLRSSSDQAAAKTTPSFSLESPKPSICELAPTMLPVGTLVMEPESITSPGRGMFSEESSEEGRLKRPASALAVHRATVDFSTDSTRAVSVGRTIPAKPRPASALGHGSFSSLSSSLPLTRGDSLIVPASKDTLHKRSTSDTPPRRPRVQSDGGRRFSPPSTPSPRGLTIRHVLTPVPDDFDQDGVNDPRSTTPLRRQSVRIASFISRFGQDAARRLTKSPTPSPLSLVTRVPEDEYSAQAPATPLRSAIRQSDSFGVLDDGSDAETSHRLYHDGHQRRRNSCGSIVEVSVRSLLYAENADTHAHSEDEGDGSVPKDVLKPLDALDLLCLVPELTFDRRNSASDLSCSGIESSPPSSPPGLSRSSSQWTPASDSVSTLPTSPCSTFVDSTERAESLLIAASQLLSAHAATLLHHANVMNEASTSLRALASESLEWGSRLMAAANGSDESLSLSSPAPSRIPTRSPSQTPTARVSAATILQRDLSPVAATSSSFWPRRSLDLKRAPSHRSKRANSFALKPITHSSLLAEAERLASDGWSSLQTTESVHSTAQAEIGGSATVSDYDASGEGTLESVTASGSLDSHSPTSQSTHEEIPHSSGASQPAPSSESSTNSRESVASDNAQISPVLCSTPFIPPSAIALTPASPFREAPVSEASWNDSATEVLLASPDQIDQEPTYPVPEVSSSTLPCVPGTSADRIPTPSFQIDDFGIVHAPFVTMASQRSPRNVSFDDADRTDPDNGVSEYPRVPRSNAPPSAYIPPPLPPKGHDARLSGPGRLKRRLSSRSRGRDEPDRSGALTPSGRRAWFFRWSSSSGRPSEV